MSRKNRVSRSFKRPSRSRGGTILGIFIGMMLGAAIVTAVAFYSARNDNPFSRTSPTKPATPATAVQGEPSAPNGTPAQPGQSVATLPGKPGDPPVEKPNYSFYNTLPGGNETPTVPTSTPAPTPTPTPATQASAPPVQVSPLDKQVYLQLGAFENAAQADDLRARLLLMGLDRIIMQRVQLNDGRVVHRIRVGPFTDRDDLKAMRDRLVSSGFSADEVVN